MFFWITFHFLIDFVSIIIRKKRAIRLKKAGSDAIATRWQRPWDRWNLGAGRLIIETTWAVWGTLVEFEVQPYLVFQLFLPQVPHECFTELLNFKYFVKSCLSISGVTGRIILRQLYFEALQSCSPSIRSWERPGPQLPELPCLSSGSCCYRHHLCVAGLSFPTNYWVFCDWNFKKMTWTCATMVFWFHEVQRNPGEISWNKV